MLFTAIAVVLMLGAVALVAAPFLEPEPAPEPLPSDVEGARRELTHRKTEAYLALRDTEMDYRMGKLSEADYEAIKQKYTAQAIEALAALDDLPPAEDAAGDDTATPALPTTGCQPQAGEIRFCPDCGTQRPEGARFCPSCGRSFLAAA